MTSDGAERSYLGGVPIDGRQSMIAASVSQGVRRFLRDAGIASVVEFTLANGRRADVAGICAKGLVHIVEIKSSVQDLRTDQKWPEYLDYCDYFYFALPPTLDPSIFPEKTGLMIADGYGAEIVRPPALVKLSPPRRRAILLEFAHFAARKLHAVHDPLHVA